MEFPLISVCVITYNHQDYIREALDSIFSQNIDVSFEVIVGDDYSTDDTRSILKEYADKYSNIRLLFHDRNIGMMGNFISVLKEAKGKYVAICEGDDYWTSLDKLKKQIEVLDNNPDISICFHNASILDMDSGKLSLFKNYEKEVYSASDQIREWIIPTASAVFRSKYILQIPSFFETAAAGDFALFFHLTQFGEAYLIDESMSVYRKHSTSIMANTFGQMESQQRLISQFIKMNKYYKGKYNSLFRNRISAQYMSIAELNLHNKAIKPAIKNISQALKFDLFVFFRKVDNVEYLRYIQPRNVLKLFFITLYKRQHIIRRGKFTR